MAIHCPECGFVNAEGANYCQKCGAYLSRPEGKDEPTTMTYTVDDTGEMQPVGSFVCTCDVADCDAAVKRMTAIA